MSTIYNGCCTEVEVNELCPCSNEVPVGLDTESLTFDKNDGDSTQVISGSGVEFKCCNGDTSLKISKIENASNLPFTFTNTSNVTTDGTYSFNLNFISSQADLDTVSQGDIVISFTVCSDQIIKKVIKVNLIDSCVDNYPLSLIPINQELDIATDDGQTFIFPVSLDMTCCGDNTIEITHITPSTINTNLGLTLITPLVSSVVSGTSFNIIFTFDKNQAVEGTLGSIDFTILMCGEHSVLQRINFEVIDSCEEVYPESLTPITVINDVYTSGGSYVIPVSIPFTCCNSSEEYNYISMSPPIIPSSTGVTIISPLVGTIGIGNTININYSFNTLYAIDGTSEPVDFTFKLCNNQQVTQRIIFKVIDSCVVVTPDDQAEVVFDYDIIDDTATNEVVTSGLLVFNCCNDNDNITIIGVLDNSDADTGIQITNVGQVYTGTQYDVKFSWNPNTAIPGTNRVVNVTISMCGQTFIQPIRIRIAVVPPCGTSTQSGGHGTTITNHYIGTTIGIVTIDYDMYTVPDEMIVKWNGVIQDQTGGAVSGSGTLTVNKTSAFPTIIEVTVIGPDGTAWTYTVNCP